MLRTAIIVPCYNEEKRLRPQPFVDAAAAEKNLCFIFVNDGSTDGTGERLRSLSRACPAQIRHIDLDKNSGKAEAVRQGLLAALAEDFENMGYWDADLATPLDDIAKFCGILDGSDVELVLGARVRLLGRRIERRTARHYAGRVFATIASLTLGLPVYDTQCGAKIFKNTEALRAAMREPFRVTWSFDVELLARLSIVAKARGNYDYSRHWVEYPLEEWVDIKGSKVGYRDFIKAFFEMLRIFTYLHIPWVSGNYSRLFLETPGDGNN